MSQSMVHPVYDRQCVLILIVDYLCTKTFKLVHLRNSFTRLGMMTMIFLGYLGGRSLRCRNVFCNQKLPLYKGHYEWWSEMEYFGHIFPLMNWIQIGENLPLPRSFRSRGHWIRSENNQSSLLFAGLQPRSIKLNPKETTLLSEIRGRIN